MLLVGGSDLGIGTRMLGQMQGAQDVEKPLLTSSHRGQAPQHPLKCLGSPQLRTTDLATISVRVSLLWIWFLKQCFPSLLFWTLSLKIPLCFCLSVIFCVSLVFCILTLQLKKWGERPARKSQRSAYTVSLN